jgi:hypothetical protein
MRRDIATRLLHARSALLLLLAAFVALASLAGARAQPMDGLAEYLKTGEDPPWTSTMEGDTYTLANTTDGNAVRYFTATYDKDEDGRRTITVEVQIRDPGQNARAGLIYGYVPEPKSYFMFVVEPGRKAVLYRRDAKGLNPVMSTSGDAVVDGVNRLSIVEHGKQIELIVNGTQIGQIGNRDVGHGNAGIAAVGIGTFVFKNYQQEAK